MRCGVVQIRTNTSARQWYRNYLAAREAAVAAGGGDGDDGYDTVFYCCGRIVCICERDIEEVTTAEEYSPGDIEEATTADEYSQGSDSFSDSGTGGGAVGGGGGTTTG